MKRLIALSAVVLCSLPVFAADVPPVIYNFSSSNFNKSFQFTPAPATEQYLIKSGASLNSPLTTDASGTLSNFQWRGVSGAPTRFYKVESVPMSSNDLLSVHLLNRLAYGPTPDEIVRVCTIAREMRADYVKTSTGFSKGGATAHDVALPGSKGPKIGFFMYPNAENANGRYDSLDPLTGQAPRHRKTSPDTKLIPPKTAMTRLKPRGVSERGGSSTASR